MNRPLAALLSAVVVAAAPMAARAQPVPGIPLAIEVRGGGAFPVGDFADASPGLGAEPGPHLAVAAAWRFARGVSARVGYSRSWFGCGPCGDVGIDDRVVDAGFDVGLEFRLPLRAAGVTPWIGAGGVFHQLVFSGDDSSLASDHAVGLRIAAGAAVPLVRSLSVKPGVSYSAYSAELDLGASGSETVDVRHIAVAVGLVYHF